MFSCGKSRDREVAAFFGSGFTDLRIHNSRIHGFTIHTFTIHTFTIHNSQFASQSRVRRLGNVNCEFVNA
jgi:hypothetical protein